MMEQLFGDFWSAVELLSYSALTKFLNFLSVVCALVKPKLVLRLDFFIEIIGENDFYAVKFVMSLSC